MVSGLGNFFRILAVSGNPVKCFKELAVDGLMYLYYVLFLIYSIFRYSGYMMLAELLQAGHPILVPSTSEDALQRPVASTSRASETSPASTSASTPSTSAGPSISRGSDASPNPSDGFHIRNRSNRVNEFLELLGRITNRPSQSNNEIQNEDAEESANNVSNNRSEGSSNRENEQEANEENDEENASEDEQNQGFLVIPSDPSTGSSPRFFSFVTQRSGSRRRRIDDRRRMNNDENSEPSNEPSNSHDTSANSTASVQSTSSATSENAKIHHNIKRLTHYLQESNSDQVIMGFMTKN